MHVTGGRLVAAAIGANRSLGSVAVRVLGLIPARGGSKGVPGKNVARLGGKPLIQHTIDSARAATRLSRIVVSTDADDIAEVGRSLGIDVPFMRPATLATDDAPMLGVVQHALDTLESSGDTRYDAVCLLQPTNPFRSPGLIDRCIDEFDRSRADAVVTVLRVPSEHHPQWTYLRGDDGGLHLAMGGTDPISRRQDLPVAYHREGSVYVTRREVIDRGSLYGDRLIGVEVDADRSVNIDTIADWRRAEDLLDARQESDRAGGA